MTIDTTVTPTPADGADGAPATPTTPTLVKDLDEQARIAYLAGLVERQVRYALTADVAPLERVFHQHMTMPWRSGTLTALTLDGGQPALKIQRAMYNALLGGRVPYTEAVRFSALYTMELDEPEPEPAEEPEERDTRGFGCDDLFEENEIGCPHCGHKLRVTLTANVRAVSRDAGDD